MYFAVQIDRGNLSQAVSDNLLKDLHMNTNGIQHRATRPISMLNVD